MLSVTYAKCQIFILYPVCRYVECRYAESSGAIYDHSFVRVLFHNVDVSPDLALMAFEINGYFYQVKFNSTSFRSQCMYINHK